MKGIIAVLALVLVLLTAFTLSRLKDLGPKTEDNQPLPKYKAITTEVKRLSAEVAALKARVSALEEGSSPTPTVSPTPTSVPNSALCRQPRAGPCTKRAWDRFHTDRHGVPGGTVRCSRTQRSGKLVSVLLCQRGERLDLRAASDRHTCGDNSDYFSHPHAGAAHEHPHTSYQHSDPGSAIAYTGHPDCP